VGNECRKLQHAPGYLSSPESEEKWELQYASKPSGPIKKPPRITRSGVYRLARVDRVRSGLKGLPQTTILAGIGICNFKSAQLSRYH
jgi:hypothetical protein